MPAPQATRTRPGPVTVLTGLVLALVLAPALAAPPAITAVQFRADEHSFRVALQSDAPLPAPTVQALADPPRLALDYPGVAVTFNNGNPRVFPVHLDHIQSVKVLQQTSNPPAARVVVLFEPGTTGDLTRHLALVPGDDHGQTMVVTDAAMSDAQREAIANPAPAPDMATIGKLLHDKFGLEHDRFTFEASGTLEEPVITMDGPRLLCRFEHANFKLPASAKNNQFQSPVDGAVVREFQIINESDGGVLLLLTLDPPAGFSLQHRAQRLAGNKVQLDIEYIASTEPAPAPVPAELPRPPAADPAPGAAEQIAVLAGGSSAEGLTITQIQYQPLDDGGERFILAANAALDGSLERLAFPDRQVFTVHNARVALPAGVGDRYTIPLSSDLVKDVQVILRTVAGTPEAQIFWRLNTEGRAIDARIVRVDAQTLNVDFHATATASAPVEIPAPVEATPEPAPAVEVPADEPAPALEPVAEPEPAAVAPEPAPVAAEPIDPEPVVDSSPMPEAVVENPESEAGPAVAVGEPSPAVEMPAPMPGPEPGATPAQLTRESQDGVDRFTLSADGPITVDVTTARYPNRILLTISGRPVEFQGLATGKTRFFKGSVASSVRLMPGADPNTTTIQIALDRPLDQVQHGYRDGILEIRALALPEPEPMAAEPAVTPGPAPVAEPAATDPVPVPIEEPATAVEPEPAPAAEAPVEEPPAPLAMPEPEPVLPVAAEAPVTLKMGKSSVRAIVNKLRPLTSTKITIDPLVTGTTAVEFSELTVAEALHQLAAQTNLEIEDRGGELHLRPGPKPVAMPEPEPVIEEPVPAVEPEPAAAVEPVAEEPVPTTEGPVAMPEPEPVQAIQEPAPMPAVVTEPEPTPAIEEPAPAVETPAPAPLPAATDLVTTFDFDNVDIRQVLDTIRPLTSSRITADPRVKGPVTIHLKDQPLDAALREIAAAGGYLLSVKNDVYFFKPAPTVVQPAPQPDPTPAVIEEPAPPVEEPVAEPEPTVAEPAAGPAPAVEEPVAEPEPAVSEPRPMAELEPMPAPAAEPEPEPLKPAYEVVDSFIAVNAPLGDVVRILGQMTSSKIVVDPAIAGHLVNAEKREGSIESHLRRLAVGNGLEIEVENGIYFLRPQPEPVVAPEPEPIAQAPAPVAEPEPPVTEPVMEEPTPATIVAEPAPAEAEVTFQAEPEPAADLPVAQPEPSVEQPAPTPEPPAAIRFDQNITATVTGLRHETANGNDIFEIAYTGQLGQPVATWLKYPSLLGISIPNAALEEGVSDRETPVAGNAIGATKLWRGGGGNTPPSVRISLYLREGFTSDNLRYQLATEPGIFRVTVSPAAAGTTPEVTPPVHVEIDDRGSSVQMAPTAPAPGAAPEASISMGPGTMGTAPRRGRYFNLMDITGEAELLTPVVDEPIVEQLNLADAPVADAIRIIAEYLNLNIVVDPAVARKNVTIRVNNMPLTTVFDLMAAQAGVKWFILNGGSPTGERIYIFAPENVLRDQYGAAYQEVITYEPKYAPAQQLLTVLRQARLVQSNEAQVFRSTQSRGGRGQAGGPSVATEKLIILAAPDKRAQIMAVLADIDRAPVMIRLDVKILRVAESAVRDSGINWLLGTGGNAGSVTFGLIERTPQPTIDRITGQPVPQVGPPDFDLFGGFQRDPATRIAMSAVITFLENNNDTVLVSNPNLTITSGSSGELFIGETIPFRSTFQVSDFGRVTQRISTQRVGLELTFSARASLEDGLVSLSVTPSLNSLQQLTDLGPRTLDNNFTTNMVIPSGESYVVAGLVSETNQNTRNRFPVLADLPLIGSLFRQKNKQTDRSELILVFTPTILDAWGRPWSADNFLSSEAMR